MKRRYDRTALPSAFNKRSTTAQKTITDKFKSCGTEVTAVYLQLSSRDELDRGEEYGVVAYICAKPKSLESESSHANLIRATSVVRTALAKCNGLQVHDVKLVSEADLTLDDLGRLVRWDYSDYLSFRSGTPESLVGDS